MLDTRVLPRSRVLEFYLILEWPGNEPHNLEICEAQQHGNITEKYIHVYGPIQNVIDNVYT